MTAAASDGGAERRIARCRHEGATAASPPLHHQAQLAAAPTDLLLGQKALGPFSPRSRTEEVASADGVEGGP